MNEDELEFAIFCIECVASALHLTGKDAFNLLTKDSNILDEYIIPNYDILHTQGREYLSRDIVERLQEARK